MTTYEKTLAAFFFSSRFLMPPIPQAAHQQVTAALLRARSVLGGAPQYSPPKRDHSLYITFLKIPMRASALSVAAAAACVAAAAPLLLLLLLLLAATSSWQRHKNRHSVQL